MRGTELADGSVLTQGRRASTETAYGATRASTEKAYGNTRVGDLNYRLDLSERFGLLFPYPAPTPCPLSSYPPYPPCPVLMRRPVLRERMMLPGHVMCGTEIAHGRGGGVGASGSQKVLRTRDWYAPTVCCYAIWVLSYGIWCYAECSTDGAMRCAVLSARVEAGQYEELLRTDQLTQVAPTVRSYAICDTDRAYGAVCLHACYAMPSTAMAYGAGPCALCNVRY
eukprot:1928988-Rhodomonas_salina.1